MGARLAHGRRLVRAAGADLVAPAFDQRRAAVDLSFAHERSVIDSVAALIELGGTRELAPGGATQFHDPLVAALPGGLHRAARNPADLATDLSIDELAAQGGPSGFHLARGCRRETGETPHRFVARLRLGEAARLLRAIDWTVLHNTQSDRSALSYESLTLRSVRCIARLANYELSWTQTGKSWHDHADAAFPAR
ncbi:AraC family transcriptional regulator (fragment) [Paraburkholderia ribeironis]|uniref:AraC family transcriptional regulator n=1 Tax=Paraburkholderia ribeironis TaxID=1247936 RepID=A0A1N7SDB5_9BURK